ncbi:hypothetical protein [Candidatus Phytoplasma phoenicium]|nr:hypothetical protein [Candidatus Phytoplasma phoenicium]
MITYEKENELSFGNAFKFGFKAFDRLSDLVPAKYGISVIGKTINFTRKFVQGVTKVTLILREGHCLWHLYNEVAKENKESAPMFTKETLDSYLNDIDRDLAKLNADYKDYKNKIEKYQDKLNSDEIFKEYAQSRETVRGNAQKRRVYN